MNLSLGERISSVEERYWHSVSTSEIVQCATQSIS